MKLVDRLAAQGYRCSDKYCAQCGKFWEVPDLSDLFPPCRACIEDHTYEKRTLFLVKENAELPEIRFAGLFNAACAY